MKTNSVGRKEAYANAVKAKAFCDKLEDTETDEITFLDTTNSKHEVVMAWWGFHMIAHQVDMRELKDLEANGAIITNIVARRDKIFVYLTFDIPPVI